MSFHRCLHVEISSFRVQSCQFRFSDDERHLGLSRVPTWQGSSIWCVVSLFAFTLSDVFAKFRVILAPFVVGRNPIILNLSKLNSLPARRTFVTKKTIFIHSIYKSFNQIFMKLTCQNLLNWLKYHWIWEEGVDIQQSMASVNANESLLLKIQTDITEILL